MNLLSLTLSLSLLPPAADVHNERAMALDEAGHLDQAADELAAAYTAMPDPRADFDGREQVLGSLRGVLLRQHQQTGAARPLCRLRDLLRAHLAAIEVTGASLEGIELTGNRERLAAVNDQLAALPADACDPPLAAPQPKSAATPAPAPSTAVGPRPLPPLPPPPEGPTPKQLRITGGVTGGVGLVLLGFMTGAIVDQQRRAAHGRELDARIVGRPITPSEHRALTTTHEQAKDARNIALGTGISSAIFSIFSVALFVSASHKNNKGSKSRMRQNSVSVAPWLGLSNVGATLRIPLPD